MAAALAPPQLIKYNRFTPLEVEDTGDSEENEILVEDFSSEVCQEILIEAEIDHNVKTSNKYNSATRHGLTKKDSSVQVVLKGNNKSECISRKRTSNNSNSGIVNKIRDPSCNSSRSSETVKIVTKNKLSCTYFNARSIVNKIDELELYIKEEELDIIGITETWLTEEIVTSEICPEGYTLYRKDRKDSVKTTGGGVALFVKHDINITEREDINEQLFSESLWCEILSKGDKNITGCML